MGMFDTVIVEGLKLKPSKEVEAYLKQHGVTIKDYQTKDLACLLTTYKIDSKGKITVQVARSTGKKKKYVSPFEGWRDTRSFLERLYFKQLDKKYKSAPRLVDINKFVFEKAAVNQEFDIYAYEEVGGRYVTITYKLKAVNGIVKNVKLLESEIESEKDAKIRRQDKDSWNKRVEEEIVKRKRLHAKWYYPILKETYNPLVFFASMIIQHVCTKLSSATYRWHGL